MKFELTLEEIVNITGGKISGNSNILINGLNNIANAQIGDLTFIKDKKFLHLLEKSNPSAIIIPEELVVCVSNDISMIVSEKPYEAFLKLVYYLDNLNKKPTKGIHPSAVVESSAQIASSATISAGVYIGEDVIIGENVVILQNAVVGNNVIIGSDTLINANVSIYKDCCIGSNCILHSGSVIGSDGFGFLPQEDKSWLKIPQIGNVVIEDDVEIGANTTIDRAFVGSTIIRKGVKLDNLIHIAHNCEIGDKSVFAAQVGIAGSTKIGKSNQMGGQVGIAGHIETTDEVIVLAQSGTAKSLTQKGEYFGSPCKPKMEAFRIEMASQMLPEFIKKVNKLLKEFENK